MPVPYIEISAKTAESDGPFRVAPFKYPKIEPYGPFANTTAPWDYWIYQKVNLDGEYMVFEWPSSEQAYHAQKLIFLKNDLPRDHQAQVLLSIMLNEIALFEKRTYLPKDYSVMLMKYRVRLQEVLGNALSDIVLTSASAQSQSVESKYLQQVNLLCQVPLNSKEYMRRVIKLKLAQYPHLNQLALSCVENNVFLTEISQHDNRWASGKEGKGSNWLGLTIMAVASDGDLDKIQERYDSFIKQTPLRHDGFVTRIDPLKSGTGDCQWQKASSSNINECSAKLTDGSASIAPTTHLQLEGSIDGNYCYIDQNQVMLTVRPGGLQWSKNGNPFFDTIYQGKMQDAVNAMRGKVKDVYAHAVYIPGQGRRHYWSEARVSGGALSGDALKTKILHVYQEEIASCNTFEDLNQFQWRIIASPSYAILKKSQGITTHFFGLQTSSMRALHELIEQKNSELQATQNRELSPHIDDDTIPPFIKNSLIKSKHCNTGASTLVTPKEQREYVRQQLRRKIYQDTLIKSCKSDLLVRAKINHNRWANPPPDVQHPMIEVREGDWGEVTRACTQQTGKIYAVLNMANQFYPGGGVTSGSAAQEENMWRRSTCALSIVEGDTHPNGSYTDSMSQLVGGQDSLVYLDTTTARVCFKGPEQYHDDSDLLEVPLAGYDLLSEQDFFMFYELRSAAVDYSSGGTFDHDECRKRICAQLDTLKDKNVRHVVLGAFGCGAFKNPPEKVAEIYKQELGLRKESFDHVVFAIFPRVGQKLVDVFKGVLTTAGTEESLRLSM